MDALRMYFKLIRISMLSRMQYRADFISGIVSVLLLNVINLGLIGILVHRFVHLNGWGVWDLVFLYSLWMISHSIYSLLFWHFNTMEDYIVKGTFDQFLIRPISPLIQFLGREIQYMGIGDVIFGVAGLTLAYQKLDLHWSLGEWSLFCLVVISATMIETALAWIIACISFWTGRSLTAFFVLIRLNLMVQQYPVDMFGRWFQIVVTGLVPVAFMNYYPSLILLGKSDEVLGEWKWLAYMSPAVALVLLIISSVVWRSALKHYTSTGS